MHCRHGRWDSGCIGSTIPHQMQLLSSACTWKAGRQMALQVCGARGVCAQLENASIVQQVQAWLRLPLSLCTNDNPEHQAADLQTVQLDHNKADGL